jgi:hypothetical protein
MRADRTTNGLQAPATYPMCMSSSYLMVMDSMQRVMPMLPGMGMVVGSEEVQKSAEENKYDRVPYHHVPHYVQHLNPDKKVRIG